MQVVIQELEAQRTLLTDILGSRCAEYAKALDDTKAQLSKEQEKVLALEEVVKNLTPVVTDPGEIVPQK